MCRVVEVLQTFLPSPLSFVQVKLCKSDNLDNPINSVSLGQSLFFNFPPLDRDGEVAAFISALLIIRDVVKPKLLKLFLMVLKPKVRFSSLHYSHSTITYFIQPLFS